MLGQYSKETNYIKVCNDNLIELNKFFDNVFMAILLYELKRRFQKQNERYR